MGRPRLRGLDRRDRTDGASAPRPCGGAISAGVELVGGLLLALGLLTPIASAFLVGQSTYIVVLHLPRGFWSSGGGIEFPLQLLAGSLLMVASGAGTIAIDSALGIDLGPGWRVGSLVVAVVGALVAMAIVRPRPQAQPPVTVTVTVALKSQPAHFETP